MGQRRPAPRPASRGGAVSCLPTTTSSTRTPPNGCGTSSPPDTSRPETLTSEASLTLSQPTSPATPNAISSPASVGGLSPSESPAGRMTDLFGQDLVPASPSAQQAKARRPMTSATCGLSGFLSSPSAALQSSLESRLKRRLDGAGSTLFSLTWRRKATPAGRPYYQLAASGLRTSASEHGSWPTPRTRDDLPETVEAWSQRNAEKKAQNPNLGSVHKALNIVAQLASWPTPVAQPANGEPEDFLRRKRESVARGNSMGICLTDLQMVAKLAAWPTPDANSWTSRQAKDPTAKERPNGTKRQITINDAARMASWATPTARDHKGGGERPSGLSGVHDGWADLQWLPCSDGKARPTQPGLFPLAHGVPSRVGKLRAYGNAIVPQVAAEFIQAYLECK
jgi:hypothetical protein